MRNWTWISGAALLATFLALPALADYRVLSDRFDRESGTGVVLLQVEPNLFAEVRYRDMDDSQSFTQRDERMTIRYIRRHLPAAPSLGNPGGSARLG